MDSYTVEIITSSKLHHQATCLPGTPQFNIYIFKIINHFIKKKMALVKILNYFPVILSISSFFYCTQQKENRQMDELTNKKKNKKL